MGAQFYNYTVENPQGQEISMSDFEGKLAKKYNLQKQHNYKSLVKANSVTIAFKNHKVIETKIKFDTNASVLLGPPPVSL